jgi:hypothetical protein
LQQLSFHEAVRKGCRDLCAHVAPPPAGEWDMFDLQRLIWLKQVHLAILRIDSFRRPGKETSVMAIQPGSEPKRHWIRILFVLPFVAMLWVSSYNRLTPELFGFPFYYWYQLLWVVISAAIAGIIYKIEH